MIKKLFCFAAPVLLLAVAGAHMRGMPLEYQMHEAGASLLRTARTAPCYQMKLVPGRGPLRPALVRVPEGGTSLDVEIWSMPLHSVGDFLDKIPAPLGLGTVLLDDGSSVHGFISESAMLNDAQDVSSFGSFRAVMAARETEAARRA